MTTDSNHPLPVFENQLNRQFTVARPDQVYVCDITHIWTQEGWLYLAGCHRFVLQKGGGLEYELPDESSTGL